MPIMNTQKHQWTRTLLARAAIAGISLDRRAVRTFDKLAASLSRVPARSAKGLALPRDLCVSPCDLEIGGCRFSIDMSADQVIDPLFGQAVQMSFLIAADGSEWHFMIHDPAHGVVRQDRFRSSAPVTKSQMVVLVGLFILHILTRTP